jgi:hypothetical protein
MESLEVCLSIHLKNQLVPIHAIVMLDIRAVGNGADIGKGLRGTLPHHGPVTYLTIALTITYVMVETIGATSNGWY